MEVRPAKLIAVSATGSVDVIELSVDEVNALAALAMKATAKSGRDVAAKISLAIAKAVITDEDVKRAHVTADTTKPAADHQPPLHYLTIAQFCARVCISKGSYFRMRNDGYGPEELRIGTRKVVITDEALAAWQKKRTK